MCAIAHVTTHGHVRSHLDWTGEWISRAAAIDKVGAGASRLDEDLAVGHDKPGVA